MTSIPFRLCKICGNLFFKPETCSKKMWGERYRCCSLSCAKKGRTPWNKGLHVRLNPKGEFKKGHKTWNSGKVYERMRGDGNPNWKGDKVQNKALHQWVKRRLGKPSKCEHCGAIDKDMYHWANKSQKYLRDLSDWIRLCVSCHAKYDAERYVRAWKTRKKKYGSSGNRVK